MTGPFRPSDGQQARWRTVYARLQRMAPGDVLTYTAMGEMFPGLDRHALQSVMRRAGREFLNENRRALVSVPTVGYRVVDPMEHVQLARTQQAKSNRALVRGHAVVTQVDYSGMSDDVRALTEATARALSMQMAFNKTMDIRQRELEETVAATVNRTQVHEQQIRELNERLARMEQTADAPGSGPG